jgi:FtsP/CotA-like multicopper oxidase with cupredoxin domain
MIATRNIPTSGFRATTAALLILGSAALHLAVAPPHLREYLPFGIAFLAVGAAQIILAVDFLARPSRRFSALLLAINAGLIGVWFISRTSGLPVGPQPGVPEAVGLTDVVCVVLEILAAAFLLSLVAKPSRSKQNRLWRVALGALPMTILASAMTAAGVAATVTAMPEAVNASLTGGPSHISVQNLTEHNTTAPLKQFTLTAQMTTIDSQQAWTYNGVLPGPELRVQQGDRVQVTLQNNLPESTTIHWHGVHLPNAADGVAGLTQDAVQPGQSFTYDFVAQDAGTYWYHAHQDTESQLPKGLFGALIVEPTSGVPEQLDQTVVLSGEPGRATMNGSLGSLRIDAPAGETVRLRLINAVASGMDGGPETPVLLGAPYQVVAFDGHDLHAPSVLGPERVPLGMGQRADLVFTMPASGEVELVDAHVSGQLSAVQVFIGSLFGGEPAPVTPVDNLPLFELTSYGTPAADPLAVGPYDVEQSLVLTKQPGFRDGRPELVHMINGHASPDTPPIVVNEGDRVLLHIDNRTDEYHPIHLHGHVWSVLARDGVAVSGSPVYADSVLVGPGESWDVAFVADNPGIWMLHCHVLLHAGMGMNLNLNYAGVATPFEMGTRSGNMPE